MMVLDMTNFEYEKQFDWKVCEQSNISKILEQNMKSREKYINREEILKLRMLRDYLIRQPNQGTKGLVESMCAELV